MAYGIAGNRRPPNLRGGDSLFVWIGGKGYIAELVASEDPRPPRDRAEAPWPGGQYTFGLIVPFRLILEVKEPVNLRFDGHYQTLTGVSKSSLQRSVAQISSDAATAIREALGESTPAGAR